MQTGWIIAFAMAILVSGCASKPTPPETIMYRMSQQEEAAVHGGVRDSLKDPYSAIFGPSYAAYSKESPDKIYVCGYVNAKNSFGAYTGQKRFFGMLHKGQYLKFRNWLVGEYIDSACIEYVLKAK